MNPYFTSDEIVRAELADPPSSPPHPVRQKPWYYAHPLLWLVGGAAMAVIALVLMAIVLD